MRYEIYAGEFICFFIFGKRTFFNTKKLLGVTMQLLYIVMYFTY